MVDVDVPAVFPSSIGLNTYVVLSCIKSLKFECIWVKFPSHSESFSKQSWSKTKMVQGTGSAWSDGEACQRRSSACFQFGFMFPVWFQWFKVRFHPKHRLAAMIFVKAFDTSGAEVWITLKWCYGVSFLLFQRDKVSTGLRWRKHWAKLKNVPPSSFFNTVVGDV